MTRDLYQSLFANPEYSPVDEELFRYKWSLGFIAELEGKIESVLDVGPGRGTLLRMIQRKWPNLRLSAADLSNFHGLDIPHLDVDLERGDGRQSLASRRADVVTCLDLLEHLTPAAAVKTIDAISKACKHAVFTIANHSDVWAGQELHLSRRPVRWWSQAIFQRFEILDFAEHYEGILYAYRLRAKRR